MAQNPRSVLPGEAGRALRRLEDRVIELSKATASITFGTTAGTACEGNDSRLSDARDPTAHATTHQSGGSDAIKLDDLAAPDDNTDLNASASAHGLLKKLDGTTTNFLRGDGTWAVPAGSGGSSIFSADVPPASPSAYDDEFPAGSINAKWSTWDVAGILTKSISNNHLKLKITGNGSDRWAGLYQAVPGSEFAIYTKMGVTGTLTNFMEACIFVSENLGSNPSTADFRTLEYVVGAALDQPFTRTWSAYNGSASASTQWGIPAAYARMRLNGTTCSTDFSIDGVNWLELATVTLGFTPVHMGLAFNNTTNGVAKDAFFKFFRCFSGAGTSGFDATAIGGMF